MKGNSAKATPLMIVAVTFGLIIILSETIKSKRMLFGMLVFISCLILVSSALFAQSTINTISGKHLENALTCEACHGKKNPTTAATQQACIKCHGEVVKIPITEIHEGEKVININPHESHYGEIDCLACHKIHGKGNLMCNECHHFDITVK